jgi:hypothetical protein
MMITMEIPITRTITMLILVIITTTLHTHGMVGEEVTVEAGVMAAGAEAMEAELGMGQAFMEVVGVVVADIGAKELS